MIHKQELLPMTRIGASPFVWNIYPPYYLYHAAAQGSHDYFPW
jgi:hypothetical protein